MRTYKTDQKTRDSAKERMRLKREALGIPKRKTFEERFWGNAEPITESGCLIWMGHTGHAGHGHVGIGGVVKRAHRVAWEAVNGPIPEGLSVLHRCDTPCCINPVHLFLGTQVDNMDDMNKKGRGARGEKHGQAKLSDADVRAIREDSRQGVVVAKEYGICPSHVSDIRNMQKRVAA